MTNRQAMSILAVIGFFMLMVVFAMMPRGGAINNFFSTIGLIVVHGCIFFLSIGIAYILPFIAARYLAILVYRWDALAEEHRWFPPWFHWGVAVVFGLIFGRVHTWLMAEFITSGFTPIFERLILRIMQNVGTYPAWYNHVVYETTPISWFLWGWAAFFIGYVLSIGSFLSADNRTA